MLEKLKQRTSALGTLAQVVVGLMIAVAFIGCLTLAWRILTPDYQVLFSDLDAQDAAAIVAELERLKVAHRLQDDGRTVLVDREDVHRTRLKLMSKGVNLRGTVGFELFSDSDFGMTEFAQKINYQRAMQGELARTIMALEEVRTARVHLVIPESGLLRRGDVHGKASVTITTRPGKQLQAAQVLGIQRLVAAAVPQIEPSAVTVLDSRGLTLSMNEADQQTGDIPGTASSEARLELKRQMETYLTSKAAAVLDRAVGRGRAIVSVDAILHQDAVKVTEEKVLVTPGGNGEGAIVRSKQTTQSDGRTGGPATTQAASTTQSSDHAASPPLRNEVNANEVEFQHGRRVEQMVSAPGAIKRLSVGIVLPETLPAAQLQKLTEVVSMAVGLSAARGDGIAIYSLDAIASSPQNNAIGQVFAAKAIPDSDTVATAAGEAIDADKKIADLDAERKIVDRGGADTSWTAKPDKPFIFLLLGLVLAAIMIAAVYFLRRGARVDAAVRLSDAERARMLRDIQTWLVPGGMR
jgi:flagellar M-ring protein FliF